MIVYEQPELQKVKIPHIFGTTWIKLDSECIMKKIKNNSSEHPKEFKPGFEIIFSCRIFDIETFNYQDAHVLWKSLY